MSSQEHCLTLNSCEHLGVILKDRVEQSLQSMREELLTVLTNVFQETDFDHDVSLGILPRTFGGCLVGGHTKE